MVPQCVFMTQIAVLLLGQARSPPSDERSEAQVPPAFTFCCARNIWIRLFAVLIDAWALRDSDSRACPSQHNNQGITSVSCMSCMDFENYEKTICPQATLRTTRSGCRRYPHSEFAPF